MNKITNEKSEFDYLHATNERLEQKMGGLIIINTIY